jgi:Peptidase S46
MKSHARGWIVALALLPLVSGAPRAEEGMWMPRQVPDVSAQLAGRGIDVDPKMFSDLAGSPMGAVVSLGGCSASFVSPDGLIVTNQHCVTGALQYNATPERNLLEDGYLAKTRAEEIWAGPGSRAAVTVSMTDVTSLITGDINPALSDRARYDVIERRTKERVKACEQAGLRCRVASFFEGNRYYEIAQLEIHDIRLVYTPAAGIGNFGGETDNWQWPRHTGDFAFYRAYVAPDGKSAPHAKDNVPYHPKRWLKLDPKGVEPGDAIAVAGYPGFTRRLETYAEIERLAHWTLPRQIDRAEGQLAILEDLSRTDPETSIKVANRIRGLHNRLTNNRGVLRGLVVSHLLEMKAAQEKALSTWIAADPARAKEFGAVLPGLEAQIAEENRTRLHDDVFQLVERGAPVVGAAETIYRLSLARAEPDLERDPEFQERNWARLHESQERLQKTLDPKVDRALLRYGLQEAGRLPEGARIAAIDKAVGLRPGMSDAEAVRAIDPFLDTLYAGTKLFDPQVRLALLDKPAVEVLAAKDKAIDLAVALEPERKRLEDQEKAREGLRSRLTPVYVRALLQYSGGLLAPDANGTLRVTFGRVEGTMERDGLVYLPQTTLAGVVEKNTGEGEFDVPKRELDAIAALRGGKTTPFLDAKLKDVPVNFLASVDTTGGNSGSPALNTRGELVGLLFDGTFDTVASDVVFDPARTRSILVDVRYMLWVMDDVDAVTRLLTEMGVRGPS